MKFKTSYLLEVVEKNLTEHADEVKEANEGYNRKVGELAASITLAIEKGESPQKYLKQLSRLETPVSNVQSYETVVSMLKMTVDTELEITIAEYRNYVMDIWSWTDKYFMTNSFYSVKARGRAYRMAESTNNSEYYATLSDITD